MLELLEEREAVLRRNLEATEARLTEVVAAIEADGVTVLGSRQNVRPHPLLRTEAELRRSIAATLAELTDVARRIDAAKMIAEANRISTGTSTF